MDIISTTPHLCPDKAKYADSCSKSLIVKRQPPQCDKLIQPTWIVGSNMYWAMTLLETTGKKERALSEEFPQGKALCLCTNTTRPRVDQCVCVDVWRRESLRLWGPLGWAFQRRSVSLKPDGWQGQGQWAYQEEETACTKAQRWETVVCHSRGEGRIYEEAF